MSINPNNRIVPWAIGINYRRREAPLSAMTVWKLPPYMWPPAEAPGPEALFFWPPKPWREVKDSMLPLMPIVLIGLNRMELLEVGHLFSLEELEDVPVRYIDYRYLPQLRGYGYIVKLCWWVEWDESHRWKKKVQTNTRYSGIEEYLGFGKENHSQSDRILRQYTSYLEWLTPYGYWAESRQNAYNWNRGRKKSAYGLWLLRFYRIMAQYYAYAQAFAHKDIASAQSAGKSDI